MLKNGGRIVLARKMPIDRPPVPTMKERMLDWRMNGARADGINKLLNRKLRRALISKRPLYGVQAEMIEELRKVA